MDMQSVTGGILWHENTTCGLEEEAIVRLRAVELLPV